LISARAQSNYAVLTGSLLDPDGHAVTGAMVELRSAATGAGRKLSTNADGLYEVPGLLPGNYDPARHCPRISSVGSGTAVGSRAASGNLSARLSF
jgi:protocatechuate 3,4-dioxygenase beta subunit